MELDHRTLTRRRFCVALAALPAAATLDAKGTTVSQEASTMAASTPGNSMLSRPIGRANESLPVIGMGSSNTFDVGSDTAEREPLREVLLPLIVGSGGRWGWGRRTAGENRGEKERGYSAHCNLPRPMPVSFRFWRFGSRTKAVLFGSQPGELLPG